MSETIPTDAPKRAGPAPFDAVAATYDTLRFVRLCAERMVELADMQTGTRVLDVATGTGWVALAAAERVGPTGEVVGVDLSPGMLTRAQGKLTRTDLTNITFQVGDATRLELPDDSFEVVVCASSLFFMPDMEAALREWYRVLRPGGLVGFSSFGASFMQPLRDLWTARLTQHGVAYKSPPTHRLAEATTCHALLDGAGFVQTRVISEQLGYYLETAADRWNDIKAGPEGMLLRQLPSTQYEEIRAAHLRELETLMTPQGLWTDVSANFALARKKGVL